MKADAAAIAAAKARTRTFLEENMLCYYVIRYCYIKWTHEATEVVKCIRPSQNSVDVNCAFQTVVGSISCIVPCGGCPTRVRC